jgi:hypothetical protein
VRLDVDWLLVFACNLYLKYYRDRFDNLRAETNLTIYMNNEAVYQNMKIINSSLLLKPLVVIFNVDGSIQVDYVSTLFC